MVFLLHKSKAIKKLCGIHRPFLVSIEADVPKGSAIVAEVEGIGIDGKLWRKKFTNPTRQIVPSPVLRRLRLECYVPKGSLATPFIFSFIFEGNGWRYLYDAQTLFDLKEVKNFGQQLQLTSPQIIEEIDRFRPEQTGEGEQEMPIRPSLVWSPIPAAYVTTSDTQKPYIIDVDGGGYDDSLLKVEIGGNDGEGIPWQHTVEARGENSPIPLREILPISSWGAFSLGLELRAASDGGSAPGLSGMAIEGDGRRFYVSAADLVDEEALPESMKLLRFSNSPGSMLTLEHRLPEFFGFPSALERLHEMFENGDLTPVLFQAEFTRLSARGRNL